MRFSANEQLAALYRRWNKTTALCYTRHMACKGCPNREICMSHPINNRYHIPQIKYAVLMTFAQIGTKNLKYYIEEENNESTY